MAAERADGVGHSRDEDAARHQCRRHEVEGVEHLALHQMLEQVRGRDRGQLATALPQNVTVVTCSHPVQPCRPCQGHLLWADVDALGVIAVCQQKPD